MYIISSYLLIYEIGFDMYQSSCSEVPFIFDRMSRRLVYAIFRLKGLKFLTLLFFCDLRRCPRGVVRSSITLKLSYLADT